jgi:hypothetical protein
LDRRRNNLLLCLFPNYFQHASLFECPSILHGSDDRGLNNLYVAGIRTGTVIVILVKLVEVTLRRELHRAWQHDRLVRVSNDHKLAILDRNERASLIIERDIDLVCGSDSLQVRRD